jgi:hypothetical protein
LSYHDASLASFTWPEREDMVEVADNLGRAAGSVEAEETDPEKVGRCRLTPGRPEDDPRLTRG